MQYENPEIPEGINTTDEHPLKEFVILSSGIIFVTAALVFLVLKAAEYSAQLIPFAFEQQLASSFSAQDTRKPSSTQLYLQDLANKIARTQELPPEMKITVHYVDEDTVNAFATLGGHVIFYKGLLKKLPSENALTMLMAHEIAHIKYRHPIQSLSSGLVLKILWALVTNASDTAGIIDITRLSSLSYSRNNETIADEEGLHSVFQIYKDVNGATDLFQILLETQQDLSFTAPEYLSTHPNTKNRITHLKKLAEKNGWPGIKKPKTEYDLTF